ncbi:ATP-binding protein [Massilia agilis]|uniref:ATP-binding protein n=1 Tax=Massilia agilis TaxID=1811226 RepID=A0ABT2DBG4_9BURK|nr:ATP-binding protein [Massilia agilis]MCS0808665.1 ATP-binding protein [Massilia agilis]
MDRLNAPMPAGFHEVDGTCETHGMQIVYLHPNFGARAWYCPECHFKACRDADAERQRKERAKDLHAIADVPKRYRGQDFKATTAPHRAVRMQVKAFRDAIAAGRKWAVLALIGLPGTGKTLVASELAESLINSLSISVRYCTAKQMISEIQVAYSPSGKAQGMTEESEVQRFCRYDLLILDEIDATPDTENSKLLLTEVINRRYNAELPVVVISNQAFENLGKYVTDRVDDRLHENSFVCSFDWPSFRRA